MGALGITFFVLLGVIVGSFLNVVILRYNTGRGINGRSMCLSCAKQLHWHELLPIISFFLLKRRCGGCESKVSWQYPLVEIGTSILFGLIAWKYIDVLFEAGMFEFLSYMIPMLVVWSLFVVIFVYDLYHKIIPNGLVYAIAIITFVFQLVMGAPQALWLTMPAALDVFAGFLFFIPFFLLWIISRGTWIGLGDGKLALGIGWLLGFVHGLTALVLAFWIGAVFAIALMLITKLKHRGEAITMKSELPFAPFLIIGTAIVFFVPMDLLNIGLLLEFL